MKMEDICNVIWGNLVWQHLVKNEIYWYLVGGSDWPFNPN